MIPQLARLVKDKRTFRNIYYLLLAFPLGLFYFVFLIVGLSVGIGTTIVWIGIPILILVLLAWWKLAAFERAMAIHWLNVDIPPMELPQEGKKTLWSRLRAKLNNSVTWKSLTYLLLKFVFGVLAFSLTLNLLVLVLALSILALVLGLITTPFAYLFIIVTKGSLQVKSTGKSIWPSLFTLVGGSAGLAFYFAQIFHWLRFLLPLSALAPILLVLGLFIMAMIVNSPISVQMVHYQPGEKIPSIWHLFFSTLTGYGIIFVPLYVSNGLAWVWGRMARAMLGMSDNAIRLVQAEAIAEQERRKAEKAEQSRRELIVNVSHELRTPVASIRGHLESLLNSYADGQVSLPPEAVRNYLTIVHREAVRLGTLVDDLLSLARTETSELRLELAAVDVGEVVEEVYQTLMPLARRERQITLVRSIPMGLPLVLADRQRLIQVLLNLVRNSIIYTPEGGIVSIGLKHSAPSGLVLTVADTGIGIPPEDLERVFERFYRTDASRSRTSGGFGLGLAIVRDLVVAMGGSVSVESQVGEGSCFSVLLRVA